MLLPLLLSGCTLLQPLLPPSSGNPYGANDYAVGEAEPYPQEVKLGKQRLENFIRRANPKQQALLAENPYVAVQAYELVAGEVWPLLRRLAGGRVRTKYYSQDFKNQSAYPVKFLLLFDQRTQRLIRPDGVLAFDTPQRGAVGAFAGVNAIYAGTGWW